MKIEWDDRYEFVESVLPDPPIRNWALKELAAELQRLKVDVNVYALGIPDAFDGGWCIHEEQDVWLVYHSERGAAFKSSRLHEFVRRSQLLSLDSCEFSEC